MRDHDVDSNIAEALARWADSTHHYTAAEIQSFRRPPMRSGTALTAALAVFVLAIGALIIGVSVGRSSSPSASPSSVAPATSVAMVGEPLPALTGTTADGQPFNSRALVGQRVILDFSSTWCVPCQRRIPQLISTSQQPGVSIITVAVEDDAMAVESTLRDRGASWPVVQLDEQSIARLGVTGVPTTIVVSQAGTIEDILMGTSGDLSATISGKPGS